MAKDDIQNTFGWLDEITVKKSHPDSFSQKSWDNWRLTTMYHILQKTVPQHIFGSYQYYIYLKLNR